MWGNGARSLASWVLLRQQKLHSAARPQQEHMHKELLMAHHRVAVALSDRLGLSPLLQEPLYQLQGPQLQRNHRDQ